MDRGRGEGGKSFRISRNPEPSVDARADAEIDQSVISGVTYTTNPPSGNLTRGGDQSEGRAVDPSWIMKGMMAQMTQVTQIVETLQTSTVRSPPQQGPHLPFYRHIGNVSQIVGDISRLRPPTFKGSSEPADIVHWLGHFDKLFDMVQCPEEHKVTVAAYYLSKGAYSWWLSMKPTGRDCVWSEFKTLMLERYHPAPLCEAKLSEILNPESIEDEGVIVIAEKFYELLQFASSIIRTEADKIKYFSRRLNPQLRLQLFNHNCTSLGEFIEKALGLELLIKELARKNPLVSAEKTKMPVRSEERQDPLSKMLSSSRLRSGKASSSQTTSSTVVCFNCDSVGHINIRCTVPTLVCRSCGNPGHLQKYCRRSSTSTSQASSRGSRDVTPVRTSSKGSCQAAKARRKDSRRGVSSSDLGLSRVDEIREIDDQEGIDV
ncbi:hypothetical protein OROHE_005904 [Orobanche hederae]